MSADKQIEMATSLLPAGHVVVPVEPTEKMLAAALDASRTGAPLGNWLADYQTKPIWAAMLAAAK